MKRIAKCTAWICIFSSALLGCTSSTLVEPESERWVAAQSGEIETVVLKDGTTFEFDGIQKGTIAAGMVRGISAGKPVAIPVANVSKMSVREKDTIRTMILVVGVTAVVVVIIFATSGGVHSNMSSGLSGLSFH